MNSFYIGSRNFEDITISKKYLTIDKTNQIFFITIYNNRTFYNKSLLYVNGILDHSHRNIEMMMKFLDQNFILFLFDFRGTGHSSGQPLMTSEKDLFDDIIHVFKSLPNLPLYILSYGIGASIMLSLLFLNNSIKISGMICTSLFVDNSYQKSMRKYRVKTERLPSELIDPIKLLLKIGPDIIANNPEVYQDMVKDPLVYFWLSIKIIKALDQILNILYSLNQIELNFAIYFLHGKKNYLFSPDSVVNFVNNLKCKNKKLDIIEGGFLTRKIVSLTR